MLFLYQEQRSLIQFSNTLHHKTCVVISSTWKTWLDMTVSQLSQGSLVLEMILSEFQTIADYSFLSICILYQDIIALKQSHCEILD